MLPRFSILCLTLLFAVRGQAETTGDVHLFQNHFRDAVVTKIHYDEVFANLRSYDFGSASNFGIMGGIALSPQVEINGELSIATLSAETGSSELGLSNLGLSVRYLAYADGPTSAAAGLMLALPVGDSSVGYGIAELGIFGAIRHKLGEKLTLTATCGLDVVSQFPATREASSGLSLGGGLVYQVKTDLHLVTEAVIISKIDYLMISSGIDHRLANGSRLRGMIGFGADENAPKIQASMSYVFTF